MSNFDREAFYKSLEGKPGRGGCILWGLGIGTLIFGGLAAGALLYPQEGSTTAAIVFGIFALLFGVGLVYSLKPYKPEDDEILNHIKRGGNNIVWIYPYNQTVNGFTSYWVRFMTLDGNIHSMPTIKEDRQAEVINGLRQLYPLAQLGYSDDLEKEMRERYLRKK